MLGDCETEGDTECPSVGNIVGINDGFTLGARDTEGLNDGLLLIDGLEE